MDGSPRSRPAPRPPPGAPTASRPGPAGLANATRTRSTARCAGAPSATAARSGPGASRCTPSPTARPGQLPRPGPRVYAEMALAGITSRGRVPLPAPRHRGQPYADPNAMGAGADRRGADAGHPDHAAGHLLPHLHVDGAPARTARNSGSATARGGVGRAGRGPAPTSTPDGSSARRSSVRAVPATRCRPCGLGGRYGAPLHVHLSEQRRRERRVPRSTGAPRPRCCATRVPRTRAPPRCTPPTSPTTTSPTSAAGPASASARPPSGTSADGIGPARALADAGGPFSLGSDSHAVIDLFEEARAVELDERLAPRERGHHLRRPTCCGPPPPRARAPSAGPDAGTHRVGRPRRPGHRRRRTPSVPPAAAAGRERVFAATAADVTDVVIDGRTVVTAADTTDGSTRDASPRWTIGSCRMTVLYDNIGELVTNDPAQGDGSARHRRRRAGRRRRPGRLGRAVASTRPADHVDAETRRHPGFVDSHAHLVFAGDRAAEFAARMAGEPYTGGGIRTTVAATRAADDDELCGQRRPPAPGGCSGRAPPRSRSRAGTGSPSPTRHRSLRIAGGSPTRPRSSARTSSPPSTPTRRDDYVSLVAAECWPPARRTPGGSTCSASAARSTSTRPGRSCRRAGAGLGLRIHANQLGPRGGDPARRRVGGGDRRPLHHLTDDGHRRTGRIGPTVATLLPGAEFSTRSPYPDARRCSTPA